MEILDDPVSIVLSWLSPLPLPSTWTFRHTPPQSLSVQTRWPSSCLESQATPTACLIHFSDIWIWVHPFLDPPKKEIMRSMNRMYHLGPAYGPLWLYRPWSPYRRRIWGFGLPTVGHSASHKEPSQYMALHYRWVFLDPRDRFIPTKTCPEWYLYHQLRLKAATTSLKPLRKLQPPPGSPTVLPRDRSTLYACALLRFGFNYGDFICWMGGEYTN
jgi:hypothetical protein